MALTIVACIKETFDVDHIKIDSATHAPLLTGIPVVIEELSKNALEAAVQLKEKQGGKVTALALAQPATIKKTMKEALAMGADEGVIITHSIREMNPAATALALAHGLRALGKFDMVLLGEGSVDNYSGQVGARVAAILGLPLVPYACAVEAAGGKLHCTTDLEDCYEMVEAAPPVVVTVTNSVNEPRLPPLTEILRAGKKPVKEMKLESLGIPKEALASALGSTATVSNRAPASSRKRVVLKGEPDEVVPALVTALAKEGFTGR